MADQPFNVAKGRAVELYKRVKENDPAASTLVVMILKVAESDATLIDYDTFAAILAGSNTEADFTNYARIVLTDTDLAAASQDDTGDKFNVDIPDSVWSSAGGATNNTTAKIIIGYDYLGTDVDANIEPITHYDFVATTDGNDVTAVTHVDGFYSAT